MRSFLSRAIAGWDRFFFAPTAELPIGVFRFVFALNALVMYSIRLADWRFYFTDDGYVSAANAVEILPEFFRPEFTWYPTTPSMVLVFYAIFLVALVLLTVGLAGRAAAIVAFILHVAFMQRNIAIVYGADLVSTFLFFSLAFCENDRAFSLRAYLSRGRMKPIGELSSLFTSVGVRTVQLQLCLIYGYTGLEKLKGASWWDGTAVWAVLGNQQLMMFDTSWLKHVPLMIAGMTFSTLLFEIYFPAVVWFKPMRKWWLLFGALLHGMIALTVGLVFFSTAMVSAYLLFFDDESVRRGIERVFPSRFMRRAANLNE